MIGFPSAYGQYLVHPLLDIVLAESALPIGHRVNHRIGAESLGHGQKPYAGRVAPGGHAGRGYTVTDKLEVAHNHGHNPTVNF